MGHANRTYWTVLWLSVCASCGRIWFEQEDPGETNATQDSGATQGPAFVQHTAQAACVPESTVSATFNAPVAVDDLIIVALDYSEPQVTETTPTVTDSQSDAFTRGAIRRPH